MKDFWIILASLRNSYDRSRELSAWEHPVWDKCACRLLYKLLRRHFAGTNVAYVEENVRVHFLAGYGFLDMKSCFLLDNEILAQFLCVTQLIVQVFNVDQMILGSHFS